MDKKPIVPPGREVSYRDWHFSPAIASGDFIFVAGCIGSRSDGTLSKDPETQIRRAFERVGEVLEHAGASFADVVEMTTYHVGMGSHMDQFRRIKDVFVSEPFPAWTAIGISELVDPDAIVEIRVTARRPSG